jgi:hypothetical protein
MLSFLRVERFMSRLSEKMNWIGEATLVFMMRSPWPMSSAVSSIRPYPEPSRSWDSPGLR